MTSSTHLRVLFRVAAGPRLGFGHLVRSLSLARAMGVRPLLSVRGSQAVIDTALSLGADVLVDGLRAMRQIAPDVVVVDDPVTAPARRWIAAARRLGAVVVTIHDLGIGCVDGDVIIDGSVTRPARAPRQRTVLLGARYAILDPRLPAHIMGRATRPDERRVLVTLGGGKRRSTAIGIAEAIAAADPRAQIRIAGGFGAAPVTRSASITWLPPTKGLGRELSQATVAVVAGGVSLYEACALGVPTVGLPIVQGQRPTVRAFGEQGAAVAMPFKSPDRQTAAAVVALLDDPRRRAVLQRRARQLVDGKGATRAAAAVLEFAKARAR